MDRLVCGDVGYGKTEVAMRAIFKLRAGRQAGAHPRADDGARRAALPHDVASASRASRSTSASCRGSRPRREQVETVKQLAEGQVDVVIGTHRLLSADVRFKDLGLLVIDEEQRFGVTHKEQIKKTKTQVDVLTLTATPIPRTLHLAMAGMRDLSIIATPPADRRAVRTFVSRVDDDAIKEAIERELARGGQIFFITPTIGYMGRCRRPIRACRTTIARCARSRATTTARSTSGPSTCKQPRAARARRRRPRLARRPISSRR